MKGRKIHVKTLRRKIRTCFNGDTNMVIEKKCCQKLWLALGEFIRIEDRRGPGGSIALGSGL